MAFVTTNSINQGSAVGTLWPLLIGENAECEICFAYPNFKWKNSASYNAGVTVSIIGLTAKNTSDHKIFYDVSQKNGAEDEITKKTVSNINAYLMGAENIVVEARSKPLSAKITALGGIATFGNKPTEGGNLLLDYAEKQTLLQQAPQAKKFIKPFLGSAEFIRGEERFCIWIKPDEVKDAQAVPELLKRFDEVRKHRLSSSKAATQNKASIPWFFDEIRESKTASYIVPITFSEERNYITVGFLSADTVVYASAFALFDAPLFCFSLISSRLHRLWAGLVCGKLETRIRYSNTLGWNTFPVPQLTEEVIEELNQSAEKILKIREIYWPDTIAQMYDPKCMAQDYPDLLKAHEENDEIVERHFFGMRPKTDEENLARLINLYAQEIKKPGSVTGKSK